MLRPALGTCLSLLIATAALGPAYAQRAALRSHRLYAEEDTLRLDVQFERLFNPRILEAIDSGMTTSVLLEFRVQSSRGPRILERAASVRLDHDIWEGRYRVIRQSARADTLVTRSFQEAFRACGRQEGLALGAFPSQSDEMVLMARTQVSPITREQQRRTRSWLNLLERASLIEFFISLDRPSERTRWTEIGRFRPEDLTREEAEASP